MRMACLAVALLAVCGTALAVDPERRIGTKGGTLPLSTEWKRKTLAEHMGGDQFISSMNMFLVVTEMETAPSDPAEFGDMLASVVERIRLQDPDLTCSNKPFKTHGTLDHASASLVCRVKGMQLAYEIHLVGRDGLYYLLMGWTGFNLKDNLAVQMNRVSKGLKMPGVDSDWGREATPTQTVFRSAGHIVKPTYKRSIFVEQPRTARDKSLSLAGRDDRMACHFFPDEKAGNAEELVRSLLQLLKKDYPDLKETAKTEVAAAGKTCLQAVLQGKSKDGVGTSFVATFVPLGDSEFLEVRFVTTTRLEWRRAHIDSILASLKVTTSEAVDAFPVVPAGKTVRPLAPAQERMLGASVAVTTFEAGHSRMKRLPDGSILGSGAGKISLYKPGATNPAVLKVFADNVYSRAVAYREGVVWFADAKGGVGRVQKDRTDMLECQADHLEALGGGAILLSRTPKPPQITGLTPAPGSLLVLRAEDGKERVIKQTLLPISHMAADASNTNALIVTSAHWLTRSIDGPDAHPAIVNLETGSDRALPPWRNVQEVTGCDGDWLVKGRPKGGPAGLYRVIPDGRTELLVSGAHCSGVGLTKDELFLATALPDQEGAGAEGGLHVYRTPLSAVRKEGPAWQPFHGELIQRIAVKSLAEAALNPSSPDCITNRAQLDAYFAVAQKTSRELAGAELPASPPAVDDLLEDYSIREGLRNEGVVLLSVVLAQCLLGQNAEWCDESPSPLWPDRGVAAGSTDSPFVLTLAPGTIVASVLYDDEGWYRPASRLGETAKGRKVVLCRDGEAFIARRFGKATEALRDLLARGSVEELAGYLKAYPGNTFLREIVYQRLSGTRKIEEIEQLAGKIGGAEMALVDLKVFLAAQSARAGESDRTRMRDSLRDAIARFPSEAAFYVMLGKIYEMDRSDGAGECARKCYTTALRLAPYGALAEEATVGIGRIDRVPVDSTE